MNFEEFRRKIVLFFEGKDEELEEETPTMSVSGGGIAGVSDNNPPAPLKKPRRLSPEELEKMLGKGIKSFKVSKVEYEKFSDYKIAHGKRYKNQNAAFRNWCRNAVEYQAKNGIIKKGNTETYKELFDE